jgi:hypothetical protein
MHLLPEENGDQQKEVVAVRIAKPLLLVTTPIGLIEGFYECYKLAGGLLFLMVAMVGVMVVAAASVVATIRREERESKERNICKP